MQLLASLAMSASTIVVGLNGALQKRFLLPDQSSLIPGNVHRAKDVQTGIGGKGQDVAISLHCLSYQGDMKLAQFIGSGSSGDVVFDLLSKTLGDAAMELTVRSKSHMRTCTSIVGSTETTELVEPSGVITTNEMDELLEKLKGFCDRAPDVLCVMGSMPPGCSDDSYARIYQQVVGPNTLCLVDSVIGTEELLQSIAAAKDTAGPTIFKMNASELCKLAGVQKSKSEAGGVVLEELEEAISKFFLKNQPFARKALSGLAITDGGHPSYLAAMGENEEVRLYKVPIPTLAADTVLFPIGAGDSVAAGTLAAWKCLVDVATKKESSVLSPDVKQALLDHLASSDLSNMDDRAMVTAFAFGLACGSGSCLQEENSVLEIEDVVNLFQGAEGPKLLFQKKM